MRTVTRSDVSTMPVRQDPFLCLTNDISDYWYMKRSGVVNASLGRVRPAETSGRERTPGAVARRSARRGVGGAGSVDAGHLSVGGEVDLLRRRPVGQSRHRLDRSEVDHREPRPRGPCQSVDRDVEIARSAKDVRVVGKGEGGLRDADRPKLPNPLQQFEVSERLGRAVDVGGAVEPGRIVST